MGGWGKKKSDFENKQEGAVSLCLKMKDVEALLRFYFRVIGNHTVFLELPVH